MLVIQLLHAFVSHDIFRLVFSLGTLETLRICYIVRFIRCSYPPSFLAFLDFMVFKTTLDLLFSASLSHEKQVIVRLYKEYLAHFRDRCDPRVSTRRSVDQVSGTHKFPMPHTATEADSDASNFSAGKAPSAYVSEISVCTNILSPPTGPGAHIPKQNKNVLVSSQIRMYLHGLERRF